MATISVYRGCPGGYVGAGHVHPALLDAAREAVSEAKGSGRIADGFVARCGDDIGLVLLHDGPAAGLAAEVLERARQVGLRLGQHNSNGTGDHSVDGVELTFDPRESEPVLCFLSDKAGPGAWNVHLYRMFADPFNSPSLVTDVATSAGFRFEVGNGARETFDLPDDLYAFLATVGGRCVRTVTSRANGEAVAVASSGADPALVVRCESPFPSVGEVLEAFAFPYAVAGFTRSAGPLMPVSTNDEASSRQGGPPRAIGLGFQVAGDRLVGPRDLLGEVAFDDARRQALAAADYLRRHGPFAPRIEVETSLG